MLSTLYDATKVTMIKVIATEHIRKSLSHPLLQAHLLKGTSGPLAFNSLKPPLVRRKISFSVRWEAYYQSVSQSVRLLSCVRLFATPWITAHQAFPSITKSWSLLKLMSIKLVMPSSHLILCRPLLLLPPILSSIRVFSSESTLLMRWPKYWSFSFSISPSNEHPGLISFRMDWLNQEDMRVVCLCAYTEEMNEPCNLRVYLPTSRLYLHCAFYYHAI